MSASSTIQSHALRNAWLSLLTVPLALMLAFVIGNALGSLIQVPEGELFPVGMALLMLLITACLLAIPAYLALRFGRRAAAEGHNSAMWAAWIAIAFGVFSLGLNVAAFLA